MIIGRGELGSEQDPDSIKLVTKKKSWIYNQQRQQKALAAMRAGATEVKKFDPDAVVRSLSDEYNCFGLVFGSRRTHIGRGPTVTSAEIERILQEDGYRCISREDVQPLDLVIYRSESGEIVHVAVVVKVWLPLQDMGSTQRRIDVVSQWGSLGEYFHQEHLVDHSRLGRPVSYYTDRRT